MTLPRKLDYMHDEANETSAAVCWMRSAFERGLLLGHSDGASIAAIYAGSHQDHRVSGLILMAPHFIVEDVSVDSRSPRRVMPIDNGDLRAQLLEDSMPGCRQCVPWLERRLAR